MIGGILVGHGTFSACLVGMLETINGSAEKILGTTNNGLSTSELVDTIVEMADGLGDDGLILFVDIFGGSCWQAAKIVKARLENVHIVTGTNLPMLLSFIHKRGDNDFDELPGILSADGVRGITID